MSGCVRVSETAELEAANMVGFFYIYLWLIYILFLTCLEWGAFQTTSNCEGLLVEPHPAPEQQ